MAEITIDFVFLASRWLHLSAAIVALGGVAFQRFAFLPSLSGMPEEPRAELREAVRKRWAPVVHTCIVVLLITGGYNFVVLAWPPKIDPIPYHPIFLFKLFAALAVFFLATVLVGRGQGFARLRANIRGTLTGILLLGAFIVLISGILGQVRAGSGRTKPASAPALAPSE